MATTLKAQQLSPPDVKTDAGNCNDDYAVETPPESSSESLESASSDENFFANDYDSNDAAPASGPDPGKNPPTPAEIFCDFNGSLGFVVGSSGFIVSMYFEEGWLPYFRYGSVFWIWGCFWYMVPLVGKLLRRQPRRTLPNGGWRAASAWSLGDLGEFLCNALWFAGCVLGGFFAEEAVVERFLPAINHLFLYGSLSLLLDPLWRLLLLLVGCRGSPRDAGRAGSEGGSGGTRPPTESIAVADAVADNDCDRDKCSQRAAVAKIGNCAPTKPSLDRAFELLAALFYCAAGIFGGFPPHPSLALPGVYFWEVGSLFSLGRSFLLLRAASKLS